jgi:hypothetical protein
MEETALLPKKAIVNGSKDKRVLGLMCAFFLAIAGIATITSGNDAQSASGPTSLTAFSTTKASLASKWKKWGVRSSVLINADEGPQFCVDNSEAVLSGFESPLSCSNHLCNDKCIISAGTT